MYDINGCIIYMNFSYESMGKVIHSLRKEKGLTQEVLSGFATISRTHLAMIENGSIHAKIETIWKIVVALDIKPSEFFSLLEDYILKNAE